MLTRALFAVANLFVELYIHLYFTTNGRQ